MSGTLHVLHYTLYLHFIQSMMTPFLFIFISLLVLGCIVSSKLSSRFSMPSLLFFLLLGIAANFFLRFADSNFATASTNQTANLVAESLSWQMANGIGTIALIYILFAGGYHSPWGSLKKVLVPGIILSSCGVLLTAVLLGLFCFFCQSFGAVNSGNGGIALIFVNCLLFGAIISSTDASAVFSILSSKRISLKGELRPLLELESGSNDPMATFLTLFFLGMAVNLSLSGSGIGAAPFFYFIPGFIWQMAGGALVGVLVGKAAVWLFNHLELDYDGLYYVLGMAVVLGAYGFASLCGSNGFMAAYVCGLWMGNRHFVFRNSFGSFADAVGWLMQVILFTILGFKADLTLLWHLKWFGLAMALFLMFVARPLATWLCLTGSRFSTRAKTLVSWVGLRGGAPIMLATFPMMEKSMMQECQFAGITTTQPEIIFNLVFFLVLLSVVCQSFTIMPLARLLKLDAPLKKAPTAPLTFDRVRKSRTSDADDYDGNMPRDFTIVNDSDLDGREIKGLGLPASVFIIMIRRGNRYLVPRGNTIIRAGDVLTVLGTAASLHETEIFLRGAAPASAQEE